MAMPLIRFTGTADYGKIAGGLRYKLCCNSVTHGLLRTLVCDIQMEGLGQTSRRSLVRYLTDLRLISAPYGSTPDIISNESVHKNCYSRSIMKEGSKFGTLYFPQGG